MSEKLILCVMFCVFMCLILLFFWVICLFDFKKFKYKTKNFEKYEYKIGDMVYAVGDWGIEEVIIKNIYENKFKKFYEVYIIKANAYFHCQEIHLYKKISNK